MELEIDKMIAEEEEKIKAQKSKATETNESDTLTNQEKANAIVDLAKKPTDMVNVAISNKIVHKINTDENIQKTLDNTSSRVIDNAIEKVNNDTDKETKKSIFENNKDACSLIGVDEATTPKWVIKCAKGIQGFWYAVWCVLAFFTVAPVVFLGKKIKIILKSTWVSMVFALLVYLAILFSPILFEWIETL